MALLTNDKLKSSVLIFKKLEDLKRFLDFEFGFIIHTALLLHEVHSYIQTLPTLLFPHIKNKVIIVKKYIGTEKYNKNQNHAFL